MYISHYALFVIIAFFNNSYFHCLRPLLNSKQCKLRSTLENAKSNPLNDMQ